MKVPATLSIFRMKILKVAGTCLVLVAFGFLWLQGKHTVPIMMYHNVGYANPIEANTVSPENFQYHMDYLKSHGYTVLSFAELVEQIQDGGNIPSKSVVITFDDAYEDNYTYAFNVLRRNDFTATIFTPSDLVGTDGHLSWAQLKEMMESGIDVGSHTRTHAYLPDLKKDRQVKEIVESKAILEKHLATQIDYFAYPVGGFSEEIKQMVKDAGYKGAAATNRGFDRFNKDVYELNRIRFGDRDVNDFILWAKLSGYYNLFRKAKKSY